MAKPIYYVKETDVLYRRRDGDRRFLPDEVLGFNKWKPIIGPLTVSPDAYPKPSRRGGIDGSPDPTLWTKISEITEEEARQLATERGFTQEGWET